MVYKGMMLSDVPNLALCFGYINASWTLKADLTAAYVCRLLRYMDRRGAAIVVPRRDPSVGVQPFLSFTSGYVQRAIDRLPQAGHAPAVAGAPELLQRHAGAALRPHRRRRAALRRRGGDAMNLKGRVAVVTGAGSGIGRGISLALARRGCHLALADIDGAGMAETALQAAALGVTTSRHAIDVAERAAVAALPEAVRAAHGRIDLLVNNAGVALGGTFEQVSETDFDWLMAINFDAVVRMTRAFLPLLHTSDDARIVNVSSVYGLISPPGQSAYSASKFAVRGFSNALRHELAGTRIGVTVVHPGGVATAIIRSARVAADLDPAMVAARPRCRREDAAHAACTRRRDHRPRGRAAARARSRRRRRGVHRRARAPRAGALLGRARPPPAALTPSAAARIAAHDQRGGQSHDEAPFARADALALRSIDSIGARSRSP